MRRPVHHLVAAVILAAAVAMAATTLLPVSQGLPFRFPHSLTFVVLVLLAALLEGLSAPIITSSGSRAFSSVAPIAYLAMLPLFGALAAAVGTGLSTALASVMRRLPPTKAAFNVAQLVVAISISGAVYALLGGPIAPSTITVQLQTVFSFGAAAAAYFAVNSTLVTGVVALDSGEPFRKTWQLVTAGVGPGQIAAAALAFALIVIYAKLQLVGVLVLLLPLLFLHHTNRLNVELHQLNRDLLHLIVKTIEAKDPYTSGHSVRVSAICRRVAEEMRLPRKMVDAIETAALLHDFGKIDVAYGNIISHPGSLTLEQRDIIRSHPARGAELLASISTLDRNVIAGVRHHHEHFDGSGYPTGLSGEEIPLAARIIMVADTVDAMLSARPYRPALSVSVVEDELIKLKGRQFDPSVVEHLIKSGVLAQMASRMTDQAWEKHGPAEPPLSHERPVPATAGPASGHAAEGPRWLARLRGNPP